MYRRLLHLALVVCALSQLVYGKKLTETNEENCEVCVKYVQKFIDSLDSETKSNADKVEAAFKKTCKNSKQDDNRFCYYIGGLEESATYIVGELSKPVSWGMPADKVCFKLYKKDPQICDLRYEKTIDFSTVDLKKMKVNELKKILSEWNEQCVGCTEKSEFVRRVEELLPQFAPEAAKKRNQEL